MPSLDTAIHTPLLWGFLALAGFIVGLSKGGLPGIGMLSVPVLALVMSPINAAVLLLPIYILSDLVAVWLYRKEFSARNIRILIPAGFMGVGVGWATASLVSDTVVSLLIGLMGIAYCLHSWLRQRHLKTPKEGNLSRGIFWGTLSGFTSFVSHAGAPPFQMYVLPQKLSKMVFAGTSTIVFAAINLAKVVPYASLHPYSLDTVEIASALLPMALMGTVVGRVVVTRLPEKTFFLAVQIMLFIVCLRLVYESL